ncbi:MAG: efflux RND transporter periplasmic adaptor subunit [Desulfobulbus sp.]|nr:efflux RND transporter periplasmic adaptor subunit [Desulfobulbus sp.]
MPRLNHRIKHALFLLLASCLLSTSVLAGEQERTRAEPATVGVAKAELQAIPTLVEVVGTLQAKESAVIAAKMTGIITQVPVALGSTVKTGDLLLTISAGEIDARLSQAEAQLSQARRNLDREQNLLKKNASTAETVKTMRNQYNMALAGYNEAKSMLGYMSITAPFDGVISRKDVNNGDLATPGTPLLYLENNRKLQVRSAVPESLVLKIHTGDHLMVKVAAAGALVQGTVIEIAPAVDPNSRTAPVVIDLPVHPDFRSGQFARVLLPGTDTKALLIPETAVVPSGQMDRVFVVEAERAHLRLVRTGLRHEGMVEILTGLTSGETVAISNNRLLENGQQVRVQP